MSAPEDARAADLALVRRVQAGDLEAFGELVELHRRAVFRTVLAAVGSPEEADDVAQDAFVAAFQKLGGFRGEASFKTWVLAIAWRKAIDRRKRASRWMRRLFQPAEEDEHDMDRWAAPGLSQENSVITGDLRDRLRRLIAALPRKLRDPLLLAGSGEHSYEEIASMLEIPVGTLKWRVSEARRVLKQKLAVMESRNA